MRAPDEKPKHHVGLREYLYKPGPHGEDRTLGNLRRHVHANGHAETLSIRKVSDKAGTSESTVRRYLGSPNRAPRSPSMKHVFSVLLAMGVKSIDIRSGRLTIDEE